MIKIITIVGARPQIIKASALNRAIKNHFSKQIQEIIVHTGQHYDNNMSAIFFDELNIPKPHYNLQVGSASHATQTANMMTGLEAIFVKEKPDFVVVYGDTNSTLAAAIVASKLHIKLIHIEAGLRSFNKTMPEEINRIVADHVSTLLFSPTATGYKNLINEGFKTDTIPPYSINNPKIYHCGDVMFDNSLFFSEIASKQSNILQQLNIVPNHYVLCTIHRDSNTDNPDRLNSIFKALLAIIEKHNLPIVLPLHPRTLKILKQQHNLFENINNTPLLKLTEPAGFLDMIVLEKNTKMVITDSGGVQKEAYFFQKPCIILRPETEWLEILETQTAKLADADTNKILDSFNDLLQQQKTLSFPSIFGNGKAAEFICEEILKYNQ